MRLSSSTPARPAPATPARSAVLLFTRGPCPEGERKGLPGADRGTELLARILQQLLRAATALSGVDVIVAAPPGTALPRLPAGVRRIAQRGQGFGPRLGRAIRDAFGLGYGRVAVIGDDAPEVAAADLAAALNALAGPGPRAALGPCADGGFYLLALNRLDPALLRDVPWCSPRAGRAVRARLTESGFHTRLLRPLADIDDRRSLQGAMRRLRRAGDPSLRALAAFIAAVLRAACDPLRSILTTPPAAAPLPTPAPRGPPRILLSFS